MAEIIQFPTKSVRDWHIISQSIDKLLSECGADDNMRKTIIERFKAFYDKANKGVNFNVNLNLDSEIGQANIIALKKGIEEGVQSGLKKFQAIIHEILFERIQTEIKIYLLEQNNK